MKQSMSFTFYIPIIPYAPMRDFKTALIRKAGGLTEHQGLGHWVDPKTNNICTENVQVLTVVLEDTKEHRAELLMLAEQYGIDAQQKQVLVVENTAQQQYTLNIGE